ncbi:MAG: Gfo/Idh/MocA family oxidoreductase [Phycisphaeraceae bacterium]|nr:Gfo/Idh/MocA family oxidoreductase [Phycisphaeraceae bacterium]
MSALERVRVAFIGAGAICTSRHLPNLMKMDGVEVVTVCNRSRQSAEKVADEFKLPGVETDWRAVLARKDVDAVFIGTWPYMHAEMSIAALEAGKHVFCQSRMSMDLDEARAMVAAAEARPSQVAMLCPPPHRMPWEPYIRKVIQDGTLGEIQQVRLINLSDANLGPLHWRERIEFSGKQILQIGIWAETLNAWLGEYESLAATFDTPIATKPDEDGKDYSIQIPQIVHIMGRLKSGVPICEIHSGVALHNHLNGLTILGSGGTLRVDAMSNIYLGRQGEQIKAIDVPPALQRPWRAEQDFIEAVGEAHDSGSWSAHPDFAEGLGYMLKMEAMHLAAKEGRIVRLDELKN